MKQIALDIGLATGPTLGNYFPGPNEAALRHLELWTGVGDPDPVALSPVPTYLWGHEGSGKTHLLKAVQTTLCQQGATSGWLDASMLNPPEFNEGWSAVLLDDVHLYTAQQQQAAFNWFVNAQTHQRGVLAAGALPPAQLRMRDDLRTRLGWGHVYQLHLLGENERRAVLRRQADARGVFLGDDVIDFVLSRFSRDLGSLMELLELIDRYALQTQRAITIPMIKSMMENS